MSTFADFTFYKEVFNGRLDESEYESNVQEAYAEIISQTNGRATNAPDSMKQAVKLCECALVDSIASFSEGDALLPKGINTVNNDGLMVSRGGSSGNASTHSSQIEKAERRTICVRYLQVPENLMYRGI